MYKDKIVFTVSIRITEEFSEKFFVKNATTII